jgi:hypothetical protein
MSLALRECTYLAPCWPAGVDGLSFLRKLSISRISRSSCSRSLPVATAGMRGRAAAVAAAVSLFGCSLSSTGLMPARGVTSVAVCSSGRAGLTGEAASLVVACLSFFSFLLSFFSFFFSFFSFLSFFRPCALDPSFGWSVK